jgi:hypothetical protein
MKFSVVPESSSAEVSALLNREFRYTQIVIDRRFDRYMLLVLNALTKAKLVRCPENPLPRLLLSLPQSGLLLQVGRTGWGTWLRVLLPFHQLGSCWWLVHQLSSRLAGPWPRVAFSFGWGSCVQSVQLCCICSGRCRGFGWLVGFGRHLLGRCSLVHLAFEPSSLGGFGSSSCCFGWLVHGLRRRPSGWACCLGVVVRWWNCILRCSVGRAVGWLDWVVRIGSIASRGVGLWCLCLV